jgi:S-disulfanyl-L-cysteine oxidoreductase SoxD
MERSQTTMLRRYLLFAVATLYLGASPVFAQETTPTGTFGFGRPATPADIAAVNIEVRADGAGLPPGSGTSAAGASIFAEKCAACHGASGEGTSAAPKLVDPTPFQVGVTSPTIGNYWPYATTVWDYINRAMPFNAPGSLTADEVYAVTAYLLAQNQIIDENEELNATSLPQVKMPNSNGFTSPDPRPDVP